MSDEIGAHELVEWMAYAKLEPFGQTVEDYRAGLGPAMQVNMNRPEGSEATMPLELYPWHREAKAAEPKSREQLEREIKQFLIGGSNG